MSLEKTAYIQSVITKNNLADTNATYAKLVQLLNKMTKNEGDTSTVAAINALTDPMPNLIVKMTDNGTLTKGSLVVVADDYVRFTGLVWEKADWIDYTENVVAFTVDTTLVAGDSNKIYIVGADAKTATLPSSATVGAGVRYLFINGGADGSYGFTVSPNASDKLMGSLNNGDVKVVLSGTDNKDLVNTKATARRGDYLELISDGVDGWYVKDGIGIWTEEDLTASDTLRNPEVFETITDDKVLDAADSGKTFLIATDAKTFTLPATAKGLRYKIVNSGADGNNIITVSPNASDKIMGSFSNGSEKVIMSGTDDKDIVNTKATARKGDYIILVGDGVDGWYIEDAIGVWTEEDFTADDTVKNPLVVETITENKALDAADSGKVFLIATDALVITLPSTAAGLEYTFINTGADGNNIITISPAAADGIFGTITLAASVVQMAGTADTDVINTKSTALKGDSIKLVGDGVDGWAIVSSTGIWASGA